MLRPAGAAGLVGEKVEQKPEKHRDEKTKRDQQDGSAIPRGALGVTLRFAIAVVV